MSEKLGLGIIGMRMGSSQLRQLVRLPDVDLIAICDLNENLLANLQRDHEVQLATTDYHELCEHPGIDIVSVAVPDYLHLEMAEAAFANKKHVMVEKPLARTVDECQRIIQAQREAGTKLMTAHVARFYEIFRRVKRWSQDGTLGDLYNIYTTYIHNYEDIPGFDGWRYDLQKRHQLIGGGCHALDLARWVGGEVAEVSCYANHFNIPELQTNDHFNINLQFESGAVGQVIASFGCVHPYNIDLHVWGTKGTVIATNTTTTAKVCLRQTDRHKWMEMPADSETKPVAAEFRELITAIHQDTTPVSNGVSGARTVALGWAAIQSAQEGRPIKPKVDF